MSAHAPARGDRAVRVAVALLAGAVLAGLALGVRQATTTDGAQAIANALTRPDAATAHRADRLVAHAGTANPDLTVDLIRAQLAAQRGDRDRAEDLVVGVVRREPRNLQAWSQLAFLTATTDRATFGVAVARIRALRPAVPPA